MEHLVSELKLRRALVNLFVLLYVNKSNREIVIVFHGSGANEEEYLIVQFRKVNNFNHFFSLDGSAVFQGLCAKSNRLWLHRIQYIYYYLRTEQRNRFFFRMIYPLYLCIKKLANYFAGPM